MYVSPASSSVLLLLFCFLVPLLLALLLFSSSSSCSSSSCSCCSGELAICSDIGRVGEGWEKFHNEIKLEEGIPQERIWGT
jgi:hypothetical protein